MPGTTDKDLGYDVAFKDLGISSDQHERVYAEQDKTFANSRFEDLVRSSASRMSFDPSFG